MEHYFYVEVAELVGINGALILSEIYNETICVKDKENNFHDGHYWVKKSKKDFTNKFTYMTERQVSYALDGLLKANMLIAKRLNDSPYDKTLSYALSYKSLTMLKKH